MLDWADRELHSIADYPMRLLSLTTPLGGFETTVKCHTHTLAVYD